jgi:Ycf66 protein N-terminus
MVNFGLNSASILGIFLAVAGAGLYFLRSVRPELSRDHDIFFAAVGLLCGLILLFQGWRLDPILQFGQFLLTGAAVFFAFETVRLRGLTTEQARRGTSFVDERPVSREYRAELEPLDSYEPEETYEDNPRLRGYDEPRASRSSAYQDEEPRTTRTRRPAADSSSRKPSNRRPRNPSPSSDQDVYSDRRSGGDWEESSPRPRRRPTSEDTSNKPPRSTQKRRTRPIIEDDPPFKGEYVDYQPIDPRETGDQEDWEQPDNSERKSNNDNPTRFDY